MIFLIILVVNLFLAKMTCSVGISKSLSKKNTDIELFILSIYELYKYKLLPFRLCNATITFQKPANEIMKKDFGCVCY